MNIQLHIERLVLDGIALSSAQQQLFQSALEAELGRLLAEGGSALGLQAERTIPALRAPDVALHGAVDPGALGAQVAQSVIGGLRS